MLIRSFEDIVAWQKAEELTIEIYKITRNCKDFGYRDQIQRASVSIMNNIAEGFERQTNKDFSRFLYIAKGSCGEVRSMLHLGAQLAIISKEDSRKLTYLATETSKLLSGFIKSL